MSAAVDAVAVETDAAETSAAQQRLGVRGAGGAGRSLAVGREGAADRRGDAPQRRAARHRRLDLRPRLARGRASRAGLLHYYFGTKEQLLVEAVRRDCELRMELLEHQLATAQTADDFIDLMAQNLQETVHEDPEFVTLVFELFTLSRRNEDIAAEYAGLMRRTREQVAAMLAAAQREGILHLHAEPEAIAEILFSLGDGLRAAHARRARPRFHRDGAGRASPLRARC